VGRRAAYLGAMATVEVTRRIAADPSRVYALVADVTRMDLWSPESAGARWTGGEPGTMGARFRGRNRHGLFRWSTRCTVTAVEPGRRFAFAVTWLGMPISSWEFRLTARDGGCEVQESTTDHRSRLLRIITPVGTGVARRAEHNRRTMEQTLDALARAASKPLT
jgi:uncharacterized protein YndB with AHSA1/START domain